MVNEFVLHARGVPGNITLVRSARGYKLLRSKYIKTRLQNLRSEIHGPVDVVCQFRTDNVGHVWTWLCAVFAHRGVNTPVGITSKKPQIWLQLDQKQVDWLCSLDGVWPGMHCPDEVRFPHGNV